MKLVVIGSGTAIPHPKRSSAAFWLETDSGNVMLDFGASANHRLAQEGLPWWDIDAVWISHFHIDHCLGLVAYLFATRHAPETSKRTRPLRIVGGKGLLRLIENFDRANNYKLFKQPFPIDVVEVGPLEKFELIGGLSAIALSTPHTADSLTIRLEDASGQTLVYTSDTGFAKEIAAFSRNASFMIIESSYVKDKETEKHLELAEAMYLVHEARPKLAMLNHFYAVWDEVNFKDEVAKFDPACEVVEAADGLRIEIA